MRTCSVCEVEQELTEYYPQPSKANPGRMDRCCKSCHSVRFKKYYHENREREKARIKEWIKNNPEYEAKARKRRQQKKFELKLEVFEAYGNECVCCGEEHWELLTIDHILGDGAEHRRSLGVKRGSGGLGHYKVLQWAKENDYPNTLRLLCFNCNAAYGFYGYCPHG